MWIWITTTNCVLNLFCYLVISAVFLLEKNEQHELAPLEETNAVI